MTEIARVKKRGIDPACVDLARHFLSETPGATEADIDDMAAEIQGAVDDWFFDQEMQR